MTTGRLDLRPMSVDDAVELHAVLADPAMWAYDPARRPTDLVQTRDYCERAGARWEADGLSYWTVRLSPDGPVVGSGGAQVHRRPDGRRYWNLNYRIAVPHRGRGLATELLTAALDGARLSDPTLPRIAWIDATNPASARVATRGGLVDHGPRSGASTGEVRHAWSDRRLDPEWFPPARA